MLKNAKLIRGVNLSMVVTDPIALKDYKDSFVFDTALAHDLLYAGVQCGKTALSLQAFVATMASKFVGGLDLDNQG